MHNRSDKGQNKIYILHLEDDEYDQELVKNALIKDCPSYEIISVNNRQEFITALQDEKYDLILADYKLPGFDGLDALELVKHECSDIPFIMLSGCVGEELAVEVLKRGATDLVLKNHLAVLPSAVERAIKLQNEMKKRKIAEEALRRSEEQLHDQQEELIEFEKLKSVKELAGAISHEFSQPLQVLANYLGIIEHKSGNKKDLHICQNSVNRITKLAHKLGHITSLKTKNYLTDQIMDIQGSSVTGEKNGPLKILIVDDEPEILSSLAELFELKGWKCTAVSEGYEALQLFQKDKYDLVISDVSMPVISGPEFFLKLREINRNVPFIFLTGYQVPDKYSDTVKKANHILNKPISFNELINLVQQYAPVSDIGIATCA